MHDALAQRYLARVKAHLLDWLADGYTHCQHGTKEWCEAYLHNARDAILDQDDALAAKDTALSEMRVELEAAKHELSCCDDIPLDQGLVVGISELQTDRERLRTELGAARALSSQTDGDAK